MQRQEGWRKYHEKFVFSSCHVPVLQSVVDGCQTADEMIAAVGKPPKKVLEMYKEVISLMDAGAGRDGVAKAVTYAVVHNLVSCESLDSLRPRERLQKAQVNMLTWMAMGFDGKQLSRQLSIAEDEVLQAQAQIVKNLGAGSKYRAVAWLVRVAMRGGLGSRFAAIAG